MPQTRKDLISLNVRLIERAEKAERALNMKSAGDINNVNLREQIRVRDEALVQLSLRLSAYGDPGGPVVALAG